MTAYSLRSPAVQRTFFKVITWNMAETLLQFQLKLKQEWGFVVWKMYRLVDYENEEQLYAMCCHVSLKMSIFQPTNTHWIWENTSRSSMYLPTEPIALFHEGKQRVNLRQFYCRLICLNLLFYRFFFCFRESDFVGGSTFNFIFSFIWCSCSDYK